MRIQLSKSSSTLILVACLVLPCAGSAWAQQESGEQDDPKVAPPPQSAPMKPQLSPHISGDRRSRSGKKKAGNPVVAVPAPGDVAAVPDDAVRLESGLAYKVLQPGEGDDHPGPNDKATLRYTGWTTDGLMFDSTETNRRSRSFSLNKVIPGFGAGLQLMVNGEKRRFWIPEELAYAGRSGRPQGMLVFDIELISFIRAPDAPSGLAEPPADAVRTESGLAYVILAEGDGQHPGPEDMISLEMNVWTREGSLYDSSALNGEPVGFRMDMTIPAFSELLPQMGRGSHWLIWSPKEMARLDADSVVDTPLVFDVEVLDFVHRPATPENVAGPPDDANKTRSGLAYKVLQPGTGERKPQIGERVEVYYAGWTTDGRIFDSSFDYGRPGEFTLDERMPPGWNEALMMMVAGEKRRVWIPREIAYPDEKQNRPRGMLVFEVELLSILEPEPEPEPEPED